MLKKIDTLIDITALEMFISISSKNADITQNIEKINRYRVEDIEDKEEFSVICMNITRRLIIKLLNGKMNCIYVKNIAQV